MKQLEFGYIVSDINHLTSIPLLVIIPLFLVFAYYDGLKKKKQFIKEKGQSRWRLLPLSVILCFVMIISGWGMLRYGGMLWNIERCRSFNPHIVGSVGHFIQSKSIFYNFDAQQVDYLKWPVCPKDKDALEARIKREKEIKKRWEEEKMDTENKNTTPSSKTIQDK